MDPSFWHQKWERNEIAFHEGKANPLLVAHFGRLALPKGSRVFVPLCGKTRDIHWLLASGYHVVGCELSEIAVAQLFNELGIAPTLTSEKKVSRYAAANIDILVGDIFDLSRSDLGRVDAIYDRAALVAFPEGQRKQYADHLMQLTDRAPQLLICFDYDQRLQPGPPFAVSGDEVARYYQDSYDPEMLAHVDVAGGLRGKCPATETVWLLRTRAGRG